VYWTREGDGLGGATMAGLTYLLTYLNYDISTIPEGAVAKLVSACVQLDLLL